MELSNKEKKKRQHLKELKSLRNKMGSNIVWFDSLSKTKQFDVLFQWKKTKKASLLDKPKYIMVAKKIPIDPLRPYGRKKIVRVMVLKYPPSLKHFIKDCRESGFFNPMLQNVRQTTINMLLNKK